MPEQKASRRTKRAPDARKDVLSGEKKKAFEMKDKRCPQAAGVTLATEGAGSGGGKAEKSGGNGNRKRAWRQGGRSGCSLRSSCQRAQRVA